MGLQAADVRDWFSRVSAEAAVARYRMACGVDGAGGRWMVNTASGCSRNILVQNPGRAHKVEGRFGMK